MKCYFYVNKYKLTDSKNCTYGNRSINCITVQLYFLSVLQRANYRLKKSVSYEFVKDILCTQSHRRRTSEKKVENNIKKMENSVTLFGSISLLLLFKKS
jgi:hypothetical protein